MAASAEVHRMSTRLVSRVDDAREGPAMNIPGVPESIEWEAVAEFLTGLGIDVSYVTADGVVIGWDSITCTVIARNADGHAYLDRSRDEPATHRVSIPIERPGNRRGR
jgi:hypothetical protein